MARIKKIGFSEENLNFSSIISHHIDTKEALKEYYINAYKNNRLSNKFIGYTKYELLKEYKNRINELEKSTIFTILSSLEASFRVDYLKRSYSKSRDGLSRSFSEIYKKKENKASLEKDILELWKDHYPEYKPLISELIGAFKFRHWLAHGRYWTPKLGRKYDYSYIYELSLQIYKTLHLVE
jgi:hypothetical protein